MKSEFLKKQNKGKGLPDKPGVYFFLQDKKIIYIGKATSLRSRTKSYFSPDLINTRGPVTLEMVFKANNIKWQETDSVLEALILEANLIKKYQPYYNIKEKDDKSWNYVCITREKLPKVLILRAKQLVIFKGKSFSSGPRIPGSLPQPDRSEKLYSFSACYGPYTSGPQLQEAMKIIRRIFPYLDDKSKNYLQFYKQIDLVPDLEDRKKYLRNIKNLKLFFEGKKKRILSNLKKEMKAYAKVRAFEKAGEVKKQIFALEHINDVALLKEDKNITSHAFRIEAYDIAHMGGKNMVGVMTVVENGQPQKGEYRKFNIKTQKDTNDTGALIEVLDRRMGHAEWNYPNLIVVDGGTAQINAARSVLGRLGVRTPIVSVLKDERHKAKDIKGDSVYARKYEKEILLANSEAHRFAITFHKLRRSKRR